MRRRLALASTEDLLNASTRFQAAPEYRRAARSPSIGSGSEFWVKTRPAANGLGSLTKEAKQDGENQGNQD
jgi:hypothetical protein